MSGFNRDSSGATDQVVLVADNVDFSGSSAPVPKITADGQLLIGSSVAPNIRPGHLTSLGSTITITEGHVTINLETTGGTAVTTIDGDTGSATGGTITFIGASGGASVRFDASGSTVQLVTSDGNSNTVIGTGTKLGTGSGSTIVGAFSGYTSLGNGNVGLGTNIFPACTGTGNTIIGSGSQNFITASNNIGLGGDTLPQLTTGQFNIAIGFQAGQAYTSSESANILIGNITGVPGESHTIRIGTPVSGSTQQTSCFIAGIAGVSVSNTNMVTIDTTTGQLGSQAISGGGITTINGNTGSVTGSTVTISANFGAGESVSFSGSGSTLSLSTTDGNNNVYLGLGAGAAFPTNGSKNVGVGVVSLSSISSSSGNFNTAIGASSFSDLSSGSNGIAVGYQAGQNYTTSESSNICIGNKGTAGESNVIRIGTQGSSAGQQNNCFIAGIFGTTTSDLGSTTAVLIDNTGNLGTVASSRRFKKDIEDMGDASSNVLELRPVTFSYKSDTSNSKQFGLIAEEVQEILPALVILDSDGEPLTVKYHELPVILLNEIIKLNKRIYELEKNI